MPMSDGHATTWGVAGGITWSHPGHRYARVAALPVTGRTDQSPSAWCSTRTGSFAAARRAGRLDDTAVTPRP
jgi:hypothetical protein